MKKFKAFALLDVILAVVLLGIATIGSYSLVKSFRSSSQIQQLTRYATNIAQNFMPFLEGGTSGSVLQDTGTTKLDQDFLLSIGIPQDDLERCSNESGGMNCFVNSGLYYGDGKLALMNFAQVINDSVTGASYFLQALQATGSETNAIVQGLGGVFSVFCAPGEQVNINTISQQCALLSDDQSGETYSVFLVLPKSGSAPPKDADLIATTS